MMEEKEVKQDKGVLSSRRQEPSVIEKEPSAIDIEHERNEIKRKGPGEFKSLLKKW